jgi:hypothetical protein
MDFRAATDVILNRFKAQWGVLHASDCPSVWPNMEFTPATGFVPATHVGWVRATVLGGEAQQATLGDVGGRRFRVTGVVVVQVFAPTGRGPIAALDLADDVAAVFEGVTTGGVVLGASTISPAGRDGEFFQVNVRTPFYFDRTA